MPSLVVNKNVINSIVHILHDTKNIRGITVSVEDSLITAPEGDSIKLSRDDFYAVGKTLGHYLDPNTLNTPYGLMLEKHEDYSISMIATDGYVMGVYGRNNLHNTPSWGCNIPSSLVEPMLNLTNGFNSPVTIWSDAESTHITQPGIWELLTPKMKALNWRNVWPKDPVFQGTVKYSEIKKALSSFQKNEVINLALYNGMLALDSTEGTTKETIYIETAGSFDIPAWFNVSKLLESLALFKGKGATVELSMFDHTNYQSQIVMQSSHNAAIVMGIRSKD
jgi:hypothetical protein